PPYRWGCRCARCRLVVADRRDASSCVAERDRSRCGASPRPPLRESARGYASRLSRSRRGAATLRARVLSAGAWCPWACEPCLRSRCGVALHRRQAGALRLPGPDPWVVSSVRPVPVVMYGSRLSIHSQRAMGESLQLVALSAVSVEAHDAVAHDVLRARIDRRIGADDAIAVHEKRLCLVRSTQGVQCCAQPARSPCDAPLGAAAALRSIHRCPEARLRVLRAMRCEQRHAEVILGRRRKRVIQWE